MKPIPDAILHIYQKSYPYRILIMMAIWSLHMKDKLHQDAILGSDFTKSELFQGFYQDSKNWEEW